MRISRWLPLVIFTGLSVFLYRGLYLNPHSLPSALLHKEIPVSDIPVLNHPTISFNLNDMKGQVWLLNVWATWCEPCHSEHPVLMDIAKQGVPIIGLDYKDSTSKALSWLGQYGDPYHTILTDPLGKVAIEWGVYGSPETFVIDKRGYIRFRHVGQLSREDWYRQLKPLVNRLKHEVVS